MSQLVVRFTYWNRAESGATLTWKVHRACVLLRCGLLKCGLLGCILIACFLTGCRESPRLIDKDAVFDRYSWWDSLDRDWYFENIPFIETPDPQIDEVYYYRWEVMKMHLTYGSPETGYLFTEFNDRPFWSGTYGGIACPLGHQLSEARWLKNPRIIDDFARYWIDTDGAKPRNYSNWYASALWQIHEVWGDKQWVISMLPYMEAQMAGWMDERFDPDHGLFHRSGHDDGMEVNINSRQAEDDWTVEGYRPTLNSYLFGDLNAIAHTADLAGDPVKSSEFRSRADALKRRVIEELWDERREFFLHQWVSDHPPGILAKTRTYETGPYAGNKHGRELIGFVPWQFNLPDPEHSVAWRSLMDPDFFYAPFGPTTTEQQDPQFYISPNCCVWSGQSWPYATTQTLVAMANLLDNYSQEFVDRDDYVDLLKIYTKTQYKDGRPYIAESANPLTGSWFGSDMPDHSEHYLHSGYVDLILGGLFGVRAQAGDSLEIRPLVPDNWDYFAAEGIAYHGLDLSLIWDRDGTRYGRGPGLTVLLDDRIAANRPDLGELNVAIPTRMKSLSFDRPHNLAVNNGRSFPEITASYANPRNPPFYANDGAIWFHQVPTNRWTTTGTPNTEDWIELDFGSTQTVEEVKLYFLDDGEDVVPPTSFRIQLWNGNKWVEARELSRIPRQPAGRMANTIRLGPIQVDRIRIVVVHAPGAATGLSEIEVWTPAGTTIRPPERAPANLAVNPDGGLRSAVSASFSGDPDNLGVLVDGSYGLTTYQANRWTTQNSPNATDWVGIDLESPQTVSRVDVYLWGDSPRYLARTDSTISAPKSLRVAINQDGVWTDVTHVRHEPLAPMTMARNSIFFDPVKTESIRVYFEHRLPSGSGATEIQIW